MTKKNNLKKYYTTEVIEITALRNVNFKFKQGEYLAIIGPSCCEKSNLLNTLGLIDNPSSGELNFSGEEVMNLLSKLNKKSAIIIMLTHSPSNAECRQRIINLFDGHIIADCKNERSHLYI